MKISPSVLAVALAAFLLPAAAAEPGRRFDLAKRASEIDATAAEHPEIGFTFTDPKTGKPFDLQHAVVDTSVPPQGRLVIWLMDHSPGLFDRIAGYGLHGIQVSYANRWFGTLKPEVRDSGDVLGKIRLEAATGEDFSPLVSIPKPDSLRERARQFLLWLDKENPEGRWGQFLTDDRQDLRWSKVTLAGISHGSTTAARFAMHQPVDRVVMFSGPRDNTETWQGGPSATPSNRFFGFTHVLDGGWAADHYCRSWQLLRMQEHGPVVNVDDTTTPYGNTRRLITNCDMGGNASRAHSGVIPNGNACKDAAGGFMHEPVWRYLFMHPVDETAAAVPLDPDCAMERQVGRGLPRRRQERSVAGWRVLISQTLLDDHATATERAIELLEKQLQEIVRVVPSDAVAKLKAVPLYFSATYAGVDPKAEYHPAAGWLREHGRDPAMEKAVEFTNVLIFEAETRRMPNFALHELAHAYHDRELTDGFGNRDVADTFERARASGTYDRVERQDAEGRRTTDRAYALTNPQEYFAETTEAYFSRNDFFPFCREELEAHDPHACRMLSQAWGGSR
jgi:hypothetical protein